MKEKRLDEILDKLEEKTSESPIEYDYINYVYDTVKEVVESVPHYKGTSEQFHHSSGLWTPEEKGGLLIDDDELFQKALDKIVILFAEENIEDLSKEDLALLKNNTEETARSIYTETFGCCLIDDINKAFEEVIGYKPYSRNYNSHER